MARHESPAKEEEEEEYEEDPAENVFEEPVIHEQVMDAAPSSNVVG